VLARAQLVIRDVHAPKDRRVLEHSRAASSGPRSRLVESVLQPDRSTRCVALYAADAGDPSPESGTLPLLREYSRVKAPSEMREGVGGSFRRPVAL